MTIGQSMLSEFDEEMQNTRKVLERCPDEKWNWKPHEKSGTLGWLAGHVGTVPDWIAMTIKTQELDYAPVCGPAFEPPKITNRKELLAAFDKAAAEARAALAGVSDAELMKDWALLAGGQKIFTLPRISYWWARSDASSFRLIGVPVPGLYGPSADESQPGAAEAAAH